MAGDFGRERPLPHAGTDIDNDGMQRRRGTVSGDRRRWLRSGRRSRRQTPPDECLRGRFVDARTIEVDASTSLPQQHGAVRRSSAHDWVNADDATQRFKFTEGAIVGDATGRSEFSAAAGSGCSKLDLGAASRATTTRRKPAGWLQHVDQRRSDTIAELQRSPSIGTPVPGVLASPARIDVAAAIGPSRRRHLLQRGAAGPTHGRDGAAA